jgi:hypothetical protein
MEARLHGEPAVSLASGEESQIGEADAFDGVHCAACFFGRVHCDSDISVGCGFHFSQFHSRADTVI